MDISPAQIVWAIVGGIVTVAIVWALVYWMRSEARDDADSSRAVDDSSPPETH